MSYIATPTEERDIRTAVLSFDAELRKAEREQSKPLPEPVDAATTIYEAIEKDNLEAIRFEQEEIAVLMAVRESFPGDEVLQARCEYLIDAARQEIESLREEIINARNR